MAFNRPDGKALIQAVLNYSFGIRPGMNYLLEYCDKISPSNVWKKISELDFEKDGLAIQHWLNRTLSHQPPPENIRAFWFGLNNPVLNDGETTCCLYLSGSVKFDANDQTAAWACLNDDSYLPKDSYAKSEVLHQMYFLSNQQDVGDVGEYMLCLGYACLAILSALKSVDGRFLLDLSGRRPVAVGYDSGDFFFIETKGPVITLDNLLARPT
jgi:hypothetical protein